MQSRLFSAASTASTTSPHVRDQLSVWHGLWNGRSQSSNMERAYPTPTSEQCLSTCCPPRFPQMSPAERGLPLCRTPSPLSSLSFPGTTMFILLGFTNGTLPKPLALASRITPMPWLKNPRNNSRLHHHQVPATSSSSSLQPSGLSAVLEIQIAGLDEALSRGRTQLSKDVGTVGSPTALAAASDVSAPSSRNCWLTTRAECHLTT